MSRHLVLFAVLQQFSYPWARILATIVAMRTVTGRVKVLFSHELSQRRSGRRERVRATSNRTVSGEFEVSSSPDIVVRLRLTDFGIDVSSAKR